MRRSLFLVALAALLGMPTVLAAQQPRTISAGMTMDDVRLAFGAPNVVRQADGWTYFFYPNRCLPRCGTDDTVFFREGVVVSAVLHSPARRYAGPAAAPALGAVAEPPGQRVLPARPDAAATVSGIRVRHADAAAETPVDLGVIRGRGEPAPPPVEAAEPGEAAEAPAGPDQERQQREQRVEPTTVRQEPAPPPLAQPVPQQAPAQQQPPREREDQIRVNTIRRP